MYTEKSIVQAGLKYLAACQWKISADILKKNGMPEEICATLLCLSSEISLKAILFLHGEDTINKKVKRNKQHELLSLLDAADDEFPGLKKYVLSHITSAEKIVSIENTEEILKEVQLGFLKYRYSYELYWDNSEHQDKTADILYHAYSLTESERDNIKSCNFTVMGDFMRAMSACLLELYPEIKSSLYTDSPWTPHYPTS